ncbi:MAG: phage holin family protein [Anaerolineaceae bacterium]|nr:MAG: phage holin family protein [Anaerolineaceae bacterium]
MHLNKLRHLRWNLRIVIVWVIGALACLVLVLLLPGISFDRWLTALMVALVFGLINAWIRPVLVTLNLSRKLVPFGLVTLVCNGLMVWLASGILPGMSLNGIWNPVLFTLGMSLINVSFSDMLAIDDDESYYRHLIYHIANLIGEPEKSDKPGVIFLEIDGLSEPVLRRAIKDGITPTLARWLETGSHQIMQWECDLSSQTSASQAGILLGDNYDIPAFRWYEKDKKKRMVSNHPFDTAEIERRLSKGEGLLSREGASRSNLFSGDAPQAIFTFSTIADVTRHSSQDFYPLFMGPYNFIRVIFLFLWDIVLELRAARRQRRRDIRPRIHRGGSYPLLRATTTVILRELNVYILIGDMIAGVPCVYATFVGYDEVAHHSGVERPDALEVLKKIDEQFDRLEDVAELAPRPYRFVVLSDHGQSQGATFKQRYGMTLEELVKELVTEKHTVEGVETISAGWGNISVFFTDLLNDIVPGSEHFSSRLIRRWAKNRSYLEHVVLGPYRELLERFGIDDDQSPAEVMVLASGNLGLIYFTDWDERMNLEQINEAFPNVIEGLAQHEGIGFILVHSEEHGPLAIGAKGVHHLETGKVEGEDPLTHFGPNAAMHLKRTSSFPHVADIMVNSFYDPETDEVAAFEELVGSHGGMGGDQTLPFVMFPATWEITKEPIIGATELHAQFIDWLDQYSA